MDSSLIDIIYLYWVEDRVMREITEKVGSHNISALLKEAGWGAEGGAKRGSLNYLKQNYSEDEIKEMIAGAVGIGTGLDEFSDQAAKRIKEETGIDPREAAAQIEEEVEGAADDEAASETETIAWFTPDPELAALAEEVEETDDSGLEEALAALMSSALGGDQQPAIKDVVEERDGAEEVVQEDALGKDDEDVLVQETTTEITLSADREEAVTLALVFGGIFTVGFVALKKLFSFSWIFDLIASLTVAGVGTAAYKASERRRSN